MRLECPNCGAQYEVPIGVIPEDGRDVQCSNCGHTWFEPHPDAVRAAAAEATPPPPPPPADPEYDDILPDPAPAPAARQVDPSVADVLRQEAEYEARARAAESAGTLESQPDLGLDDLPDADDDSARRAREAQERMEARRGASAPDAQPDIQDAVAATIAASAAAGPDDRPRRDQLPDIEDINATLRSSKEPRLTDRAEPPPHVVAEDARRRSFRRGFMMMLLIAVILVALYIFAPRIAEAVPQLKAPLDQYVAIVNQGRVWLDAQVAKGLVWLDSMASETAPPVSGADVETPAQDQ